MSTMTLDRLLGKVALLSGLSLFNYNCESAAPEPTSCVKDTDCKGERVCDSNTKMCVEYTPATQTKYTCEDVYAKTEICCNQGLYREKWCDDTLNDMTKSQFLDKCNFNKSEFPESKIKCLASSPCRINNIDATIYCKN